ncbi:S-adenosyl methyltransferase [Halopolyspora algeriensis]|uniref:S-adenosyl methyltransferase n=1 Tax=Halopolyspora algeriensis TaxID=1500506 RepID=A0A368VRZ9_9ACTN|nr:SAM-dependent methyltransferase [Halopolyspora algeriensis]RCW44479.1 S-adenosyl methyltransferase [Halopolyspora algeriensis]TQM55841.1 S-adenosyl methyltransferase [Halopolyspora algeriensis]
MDRHRNGDDQWQLSPGAAAGLDVQHPNAARMYDYYLGGAANFAVDRQAAEQALAITPEIGRFARANRSFLGRAVAQLCEQGIDQFLDLGSGVPTVGNVHEIAHRHNPEARIAYVDIEPVAVSHARQLLDDDPLVSVTQADIRHPGQVLAAPEVAGLLDFDRPVAVLAVAILHFVPDTEDPAGIMATYRDACVPGSYLVLSHAAAITMTAQEASAGQELYRGTTTPLWPRSAEEITPMLAGYHLIEPGLVPVDQWRPDAPTDTSANGYGAVGLLSAS